jgi:hypothetical protein
VRSIPKNMTGAPLMMLSGPWRRLGRSVALSIKNALISGINDRVWGISRLD